MAESFKKTTFTVMIFGIITRLIAFIFKIYLSRAVGAEALGIYQIAMAVWALATTLCGSGLAVTVSRKTAEGIALKKREGATVSGALLLGLALVALLSGLFFALGDKIDILFSDPRAISVFYILLPALVTTCAYNILRSYIMGKKRYVLFSLTELIEEILNVIAVLILLSGMLGVFSGQKAIALAFTICDVICFFIILVIYFKEGGRFSRPEELGSIIKSSAPITLMRIISALAVSLTAIILPQKLTESGLSISEATAEFGRATGMAYPILFAPLAITSALSVVLLPEIAYLNAKNDRDKISEKVDTSMTFIFLISIIFYIIYSIFGEDIGRILFSDEKAGQFLSSAAGMIVPMAMSGFSTTVLNSLGKENTCFFNNTLSIGSLLISVIFLPKYLGIYALAIGQTACFVLTFTLNAIALEKIKIGNSAYMSPLIKCSVFALLCFALFKPLDLWLSQYIHPNISAILLSFTVLALYAVFLQIFGIFDIKKAISTLYKRIFKKCNNANALPHKKAKINRTAQTHPMPTQKGKNKKRQRNKAKVF